MRRPLVIALVLMGGGALAAGLMLPGRGKECEQARAANLPNAEEICARTSSSRGSSGGYHSYGGSSGIRTAAAVAAGLAASRVASTAAGPSTAASTGSVSRGGFGGSGGGFSSSGSS